VGCFYKPIVRANGNAAQLKIVASHKLKIFWSSHRTPAGNDKPLEVQEQRDFVFPNH
jgi:hypothetical protein